MTPEDGAQKVAEVFKPSVIPAGTDLRPLIEVIREIRADAVTEVENKRATLQAELKRFAKIVGDGSRKLSEVKKRETDLMTTFKSVLAQGSVHEDGECPGDDTCSCVIAKNVNDCIAAYDKARKV